MAFSRKHVLAVLFVIMLFTAAACGGSDSETETIPPETMHSIEVFSI